MDIQKSAMNSARKRCKQFEELTDHKAMPIVVDGQIKFQITLAEYAAREEKRVVIWEDLPRYTAQEILIAKTLERKLSARDGVKQNREPKQLDLLGIAS